LFQERSINTVHKGGGEEEEEDDDDDNAQLHFNICKETGKIRQQTII